MGKIKISTVLICTVLAGLISCVESEEVIEAGRDMNQLADEYVFLILSLGQHDQYYVDSYFGPDSLKQAAENEKLDLETIKKRLIDLRQDLSGAYTGPETEEELNMLRKKRLLAHVESAIAFTEKISGTPMTFQDEVHRMYDFDYETLDIETITAMIDSVDALMPGTGSIADRWQKLRNKFKVPLEKIDTLFLTTIESARQKTSAHIPLPQTEEFKVEYVSDQPWSAYNWYKGNYYSLIQVNTDNFFIDRPIDLAAHEGYPGHHIYQTVMEKSFLKDRYWAEYSIYPLYSPTSFLSEGLAEYGINVAFPGDERYYYERDTLLPLAGLDTTGFDLYKQVSKIVGRLDHAGLYAAAGLMNGNLSEEEAEDFLINYALLSPEKAKQRVEFIQRYGAYIINYTLGYELIADYIDKVNPSGNSQGLWSSYMDILSNPYLPSSLVQIKQQQRQAE